MTKIDKQLYEKIGSTLRTAREEKGYSLEYVAEKVNLTKKTIQRYETAESRISVNILEKICNVLDLNIDEITGFFFFDFQDEEEIKVSYITKSTIQKNDNVENFNSMGFDTPTDALKFILEQPIFASNVGYDPKKMTDDQLIKLANKILKFTKMEIEDLEEIDPKDI